MESTVDTEAHTVSAETKHFTQFAVIGNLSIPELEAAPASFIISDLSVTPSEVVPGQEVIVSAVVTNNGGSEGKYNIVLKVNGTEEGQKEVTLGAGDSQEVSFELVKNVAGLYEMEVNGLTGSFVVEEAVVAPLPSPAQPLLPINLWLIAGLIAGAAIVSIAVWQLATRRKAS